MLQNVGFSEYPKRPMLQNPRKACIWVKHRFRKIVGGYPMAGMI